MTNMPSPWESNRRLTAHVEADLAGRRTDNPVKAAHPRVPGKLEPGVLAHTIADPRRRTVQTACWVLVAGSGCVAAAIGVYDGRDTLIVLPLLVLAVVLVRIAVRAPRSTVGANDSVLALVGPTVTRVLPWSLVAGVETGSGRLGGRVHFVRTATGRRYLVPWVAQSSDIETLEALRPS